LSLAFDSSALNRHTFKNDQQKKIFGETTFKKTAKNAELSTQKTYCQSTRNSAKTRNL